ncbi:MAG: YlbF family regulator [Lachnospirales bacterium]
MNNFQDFITNLKEYLEKDEDYTQYKFLEKELKKDTELYNKVCSFKKIQMQDYITLGENRSFIDPYTEANKLYTEIFISEVGREFLLCENRVLEKMKEISDVVGSVFEIDLPTL